MIRSVIFSHAKHTYMIVILSIIITITFSKGYGQWMYKQKLTIPATGNLLTNYPVAVNLNAENFDYSKVLPNGEDIRFSTDSTDILNEEIDYWIEEWNISGTSYVWVKLPLLLMSGEVILHMYFGNDLAEDNGDIASVFDFFDHRSQRPGPRHGFRPGRQSRHHHGSDHSGDCLPRLRYGGR